MIKKHIPTSIKRLIKRFISCATWDQWLVRSWSQEGEDQILRRIFEREPAGFYIDIGAHHPKRFSNTYLFYRRGWRGINIDAMPGSMKVFNKVRPRDVNLEIAVGVEEGELDYYVFNEPALNGFSKELSLERHGAASTYKVKEVIKINLIPLSSILDRYLPKDQIINFMSVDVEGLDLDVLKSNDWVKYRPKFVLSEILESSLHEIEQSEIGQFMNDAGYRLYAKCVNTVFFKEANQK
ncbi:MAG: FkbM family methyltransferase [Pseudomonadales bacterium]